MDYASVEKPDDCHLVFREFFQVTHQLPHEPGVLRHPHLRHVVLDVQGVAQSEGRSARRKQTPAYQGDIRHPRYGHAQANQRKVKHVERHATLFHSEVGCDDIRRGPNQRYHAAEKRRKG